MNAPTAKHLPPPLFPLGRVVITPGASEALKADGAALMTILVRHRTGDWGDLDDEDKHANNVALSRGTRLLSAYHVKGTEVWIITEADRSATTILLPEEY